MSARAWALMLVITVGCGGDPTRGGDPTHRLIVDVRSDFAPGYEALAISVRVGSTERVRLIEPDDSLLDPPLRTATLTLPDGPHVVEVELRTKRAALSRRVLVLIKGGDTTITLSLTRECIGVVCSDDAAESCLAGVCVSSECIDGQQDACEGVERCRDDGCPASPIACATSRCVDGICALALDSRACLEGEYCSATNGCEPLPLLTLDAGGTEDLDGGAVDGGADDAAPTDAPTSNDAETSFDVSPPLTPTTGFEQVSGSDEGSCALRRGEIWCFGRGPDGDGLYEPMALTKVANISDASAVACGGDHCCALREGGVVSCWGENGAGQCGIGVTSDLLSRVDVDALPPAVSLSAGHSHTCAVTSAGEVWCWGANDVGQVGPMRADPSEPGVVMGVPGRAVSVHLGGSHSCAILNDGRGMCWGNNSDGQLGAGIMVSESGPVMIDGLSDIATLDTELDYVIARTDSGEVYHWGQGPTRLTSPASVAVTGARAVVAGWFHACKATTDEVFCWGQYNDQLQLGRTGEHSWTPMPVNGLPPAVQLGAGRSHTCAITDTTEMYCWGNNDGGAIDFDAIGTSQPPTQMQITP